MAYYSKEVIEAVSSISALQYMQDHESYNLFKKGHVFFLKEHDSLYFNNGFFRWCSQGIGGKSALDFLQKVRGMSFLDAMHELCTLYNIDEKDSNVDYSKIVKSNKEINEFIAKQQASEKENREFSLPEAADDNKRVYAYLRKRGITDNVIKFCLKNKLLYQEANHGNCVFVGYDNNGVAKYAGQRATGYKSFKGDVTGSDKAYSFRLICNDSKTVHLFEAPIDLLSYASYMEMEGYDFTRTNLLSLSGIAIPRSNGDTKIPDAIETFLDGREIETFCIHFDNDQPGEKASRAIANVLAKRGYKAVEAPVPKECGKDINDFLLGYIAKKSGKDMVK